MVAVPLLTPVIILSSPPATLIGITVPSVFDTGTPAVDAGAVIAPPLMAVSFTVKMLEDIKKLFGDREETEILESGGLLIAPTKNSFVVVEDDVF